MPFSTEPLEPHVRAILANVSDADLQTISGKRVRRELVATVPDLLSAEDAKAHKDDLDALIGDVFSQVSRARLGPPAEDGEEQDGDETGENGGDGDVSEGADGTPAADEDDDDDDEDGEEKKPPKKKQKRARGELTDEQLARQLSSELNGRQRSTRAGGGGTTKRGGRGGGRGGKRGAKSAARVEESDDEDGEGSKKKRKRKASSGAGGGGAKGGFGKEYALRYARSCFCLSSRRLTNDNRTCVTALSWRRSSARRRCRGRRW
jgi:upstream activation factor subunit UAF30